MNMDRIYLISDIEGFTPQIGRLVSMMNYARLTTLTTVKGLSVEQLDHKHDAKSNSIGALLLHMAAVEFGYQRRTFYNRNLHLKESTKWGAALRLGNLGRSEINGNPLDYYLQALADMRKVTLEELRKRDDGWLYEETEFWNGKQANNYFKWFHVYEDEINHRGQIRWLRQRLPE